MVYKTTEFQTTHNLIFEVANWEIITGHVSKDFARFRVGTCTGIWGVTPDTYDILGVGNSQPGNGHFTDVLEFFYNSCVRDKKDLRILEVWNQRLKKHLIEKKGFKAEGPDGLVKRWKDIKAERRKENV